MTLIITLVKLGKGIYVSYILNFENTLQTRALRGHSMRACNKISKMSANNKIIAVYKHLKNLINIMLVCVCIG